MAEVGLLISVVVMGPLLILPPWLSFPGVLLLLPVLAFLVVKLVRSDQTSLQLADVAVLILTGMGIVVALLAYEPIVSRPKLLGLLYAVSTYFAVRLYAVTRERAINVAILLASYGFGIGLVGFFGTQWLDEYVKTAAFTPLYSHIPRLITGLSSSHGIVQGFHPNEVAGTLAPLVLVAVGVCATAGDRFACDRGRALLTIGLTMVSIATMVTFIILSVSRAAWLGLAAAAIVVLVLCSLRRFSLWGSIVLVPVLPILLATRPLFSQFFVASDLTWDAASWGRPTRYEIWLRAIQMIQDYPFTGIGLNMFPHVLHSLYPLSLYNEFFVPHAHNVFLQTALDYGLPGLLSFVVLLAVAVTAAGRSFWVDPGQRKLAICIGGALVSFVSFGSFDAVAVGAKPTFLFFAIIALAVGLNGKFAASGILPGEWNNRKRLQ